MSRGILKKKEKKVSKRSLSWFTSLIWELRQIFPYLYEMRQILNALVIYTWKCGEQNAVFKLSFQALNEIAPNSLYSPTFLHLTKILCNCTTCPVSISDDDLENKLQIQRSNHSLFHIELLLMIIKSLANEWKNQNNIIVQSTNPTKKKKKKKSLRIYRGRGIKSNLRAVKLIAQWCRFEINNSKHRKGEVKNPNPQSK